MRILTSLTSNAFPTSTQDTLLYYSKHKAIRKKKEREKKHTYTTGISMDFYCILPILAANTKKENSPKAVI
jgi:hypothetical protein